MTNNIRLVKNAISDLQLGFPVVFDDREISLYEFKEITTNKYVLISPSTSKLLGLGNNVTRLYNSNININFFTKGEEIGEIKDYEKGDETDDKIIQLAKLTGRLPIVLVEIVDPSPKNLKQTSCLNFSNLPHECVTQGECDNHISKTALNEYIKYTNEGFKKVAEAKVPLLRADTTVMLFRSPSGIEHIAIQAGEISDIPLVRIHSACITGDLFESLKCDCGEQLHTAIEKISNGGVVLYMNQEGRGIQLENKLRAYNLQANGFDTVDANEQLGFEPDERDFSAASDILKQLGITKIKLLTNNPKKQDELEIEVVERVPLAICPNATNKKYLDTKKNKMGHFLQD